MGLLSDALSSVVTSARTYARASSRRRANGAGGKTSGILKASSRVPDSGIERGSGAAHRPSGTTSATCDHHGTREGPPPAVKLAVLVGAIRSARCRSENPLSERPGLLLGACHEAMRGREPVQVSHVRDYRSGCRLARLSWRQLPGPPRTHAALAPPVRWLGSEGKEGADVRSW
jgi:hypothetical protein